jgi:hypothetical protein
MKLLLFLAISFFSVSGTQQPKIFTTNTGQMRFRSEAPLELINASSKELKGAIDAGKKTFAFRIRINSFEGFNSPLQKEHFNENYMESVKIPEAAFSGKIIEDIDFTKPGKYSVRAKGILTVHGIDQERIIRNDVEVSNGLIIIKSSFTVLLSDHNIPIPRVVKEKLANEIKVELVAELVQK